MTDTVSTAQSNKELKEAMAININYNNQPLKKHHNQITLTQNAPLSH